MGKHHKHKSYTEFERETLDGLATVEQTEHHIEHQIKGEQPTMSTAEVTPNPTPAPAPAAEPTPIPAPSVPKPPTATLSANPSTINPGQSTTLTWSSTDAVSANLSNVGPVSVEGTQSVTPSVSTNYTLKVTAADGASQTANATVLVTGTPAPPPVPAPIATPSGGKTQTQLDIMSDVAALKGTLSSVAADARAEYEQLNEAAKGMLHQAFNDVEQKFNVELAKMHTLFGAK